jgi:hypothetical protein
MQQTVMSVVKTFQLPTSPLKRGLKGYGHEKHCDVRHGHVVDDHSESHMTIPNLVSSPPFGPGLENLVPGSFSPFDGPSFFF